jgi:hypothetical protein
MNSPPVPGQIIYKETLPARAYWHKRLNKGSILRIVDLEGIRDRSGRGECGQGLLQEPNIRLRKAKTQPRTEGNNLGA